MTPSPAPTPAPDRLAEDVPYPVPPYDPEKAAAAIRLVEQTGWLSHPHAGNLLAALRAAEAGLEACHLDNLDYEGVNRQQAAEIERLRGIADIARDVVEAFDRDMSRASWMGHPARPGEYDTEGTARLRAALGAGADAAEKA